MRRPLFIALFMFGCDGAAVDGNVPAVCRGLRLVSAGETSVKAIDTGGRIWRWQDGRVIDATGDFVGDVGAITAIANQDDRPCFLLADGNAHCPGKGWHEAGIAAIANERLLPTGGNAPVPPMSAPPGPRYATCFVKAEGSLVCARLFPDSPPAIEPVLGSDVVAVAIGAASFAADCALKRDGTVWCRGQALPRSQRTGTQASGAPVWRQVTRAGRDGIQIEVATAGSPACVVKRNGTVWCWNTDAWYDTRRPDTAEPHVLDLLGADVAKVAVGRGWLVALKKDGTLQIFGSRLNVPPTLASSAAPKAVEGLPAAVTDISAGSDYFCALLADATVWCRGSSLRGQRGYSEATLGAAPLRGCTAR